eukprot:1370539-Prymnesium_polylepis.1
MASLPVCRSPCLIQTRARPCHDHVLTVCLCSQVALAGDERRAAARVRHSVRTRCAAARQLRAEH